MIVFFAVLAIAINAILMIAFYRRLSARFSPDRVLGEIRGELDRLVADLGRETDRDVALLENRIQGLRSLIDEADRRILLANREAGKRREETTTLAALSGDSGGARVRGASDTVGGTVASVESDSASDSAAGTRVRDSTAAPPPQEHEYSRASMARARVANASRRVEPVIPTVERVVSLANRGFSADLIASKLSLSLGEVELIMDMRVRPVSGFDSLTKDSSS